MEKRIFILLIIGIPLLFFYPQEIKAGLDDNVFGWAWSENIGWISFNCTDLNTCGNVDYGVNIKADRTFEGYAWSENIGWISFNESELTGCPSAPCQAKFDATGQVSGWARACAVFANPNTCSGALDPNRGGWEGWIKLRGTWINPDTGESGPYGVSISTSTGEFFGYAWGSEVVGWIKFNCATQPNECATSNYKVRTSFTFTHNQSPTAAISCNPLDCKQYYGSPLILINESTDPDGDSDIVKSQWFIKSQGTPDSNYRLLSYCNCNEKCNCTPQADIGPGQYTVKLYIEDSVGNSDTAFKDFQILKDAEAGFMCSLDNLNWKPCEELELFEEKLVYFKDDPSLPEHSTPSQGATAITSRIWKINDNIFDSDNNPNPLTNLNQASNIIELTITDNKGRTDSVSHTISTKIPLPEWKEVSPF